VAEGWPLGQLNGYPLDKIIGSEILVGLSCLQHVVDDDRNGMRNGHGSPITSPTGRNTVVLVGQVGVLVRAAERVH
jgi:hypothetical protein